MIQLNAKKVKISDGSFIMISEDSFEHLLACLDNQKFIPIPDKQTDNEKKEFQDYIDNFNIQCRNVWLSNKEPICDVCFKERISKIEKLKNIN